MKGKEDPGRTFECGATMDPTTKRGRSGRVLQVRASGRPPSRWKRQAPPGHQLEALAHLLA